MQSRAQAPPSPQRLDPRHRQPADGPVERDLSRAAAAFLTVTLGLPVAAMGALDGVAEATADIRQARLGPAQRPQPPAQAVDPARLWHGGAVQAAVPAGAGRAAGARRALRRPHRQGHSRRAARRDDRRRNAARDPRPRLRPSPVARHRRGVPRAARRGRADDAVRQRHPRRVLDRGDPGAAVASCSPGWCCAEPSGRARRAADTGAVVRRLPRARPADAAADRGRLPVRAGPLFGELPDPARRSTSGCRRHWSPLVLVLFNLAFFAARLPGRGAQRPASSPQAILLAGMARAGRRRPVARAADRPRRARHRRRRCGARTWR